MVDLSLEEKHLLRLLAESRKSGAASMEVRGGMSQKAAHGLREKGLAQWHGNQYGSSFWYATDEGLRQDLTFG